MKPKLTFLLAVLFIFACKPDDVDPVPVPGGKGGTFNLAIFPNVGSKGIAGKVYIKYGSVDPMRDSKNANDSNSTMVEPGYGPHVHFFELKEGYYALKTTSKDGSMNYEHDTVICIQKGQAISTDINIYLK